MGRNFPFSFRGYLLIHQRKWEMKMGRKWEAEVVVKNTREVSVLLDSPGVRAWQIAPQN